MPNPDRKTTVLIRNWQTGDHAALEGLLELHLPWLHGQLRHRMPVASHDRWDRRLSILGTPSRLNATVSHDGGHSKTRKRSSPQDPRGVTTIW